MAEHFTPVGVREWSVNRRSGLAHGPHSGPYDHGQYSPRGAAASFHRAGIDFHPAGMGRLVTRTGRVSRRATYSL